MSALPVTESDRIKASQPVAEQRGTGRGVKSISKVGKVKARLMPNGLLTHLYPSTTGEARRSIRAEMSRRGISYKELVAKEKTA